ncbi:P-loop NTPase [Rhizobium leguminosarum]
MTFKEITDSQEESFVSALAAGQYNLLLGAGASMDSSNTMGLLPTGEAFKDELCGVTGASTKHSLQRVFSLLDEKQVDKHVTSRFINCRPGPTADLLSRFLWKRIFTWNIDDVLQRHYKEKRRKQKLITVHYKDEFKEASSLSELMAIHLHGTVLFPEKGYVFSREHYIQQAQTINPWMSVLSTFMRSEPMIISGTSLDEPDLDHYLSFRSELTARDDRGPSVLVTKDDDAITADLCKRHNLLHFIGWTSDFLEYCVKKLPHPPTPEELAPAEMKDLIPAGISRTATIAFNSDFELVPGSAIPATNSRFQYGHVPTWQDFAARLDIPQSIGPALVVQIEKMLADLKSPAKLILLAGVAGSGKTTIVRRAAFELSKRGVKTFECSALSRIDRSTADVLNAIEGPTVVMVDNFADQAAAIAETMGRLTRPDIVFVAAERSYRQLP